MAPIRILGAGPSGLAAAITLARAGHDVEVLERRGACGARFGGDLQGIENWSSDEDALGELRAIGVDPDDFDHDPFDAGVATNGRAAHLLRFPRPAFYLVKRGAHPRSLDQSLARQAAAAGVRLRFHASIDPAWADIVATGGRGRPFAVDRGIVFETDAPDLVVVLMNDRAAPRGYSYLLVTKGYGCLCTMLFDDFPSVRARLAEARRILLGRHPIAIRDERPVGGSGHFAARPAFRVGNAARVGEAAGLQDFLWGFGIRMAVRSGVLAARCLLDGADYEMAARARFTATQRAGVVNRLLWETLRLGDYRMLMALFRLAGPYRVLHSFAGFNPAQRVLYPLAERYVRWRHPQVMEDGTTGGA